MKYHIVNTESELFKKYQNDIYKLRHKVFKEELNWKVETVDGDKEIDVFDSIPNLHYILVTYHNKLIGSMRLLPTETDYMLERVFPILLDYQNIPKDEQIWELSRFVVDPTFQKNNELLKFNKVTLLLLKGICEFAKTNNIQSYLAVTTDRMSRLVKNLAMDSALLGKKVRIDKTNVITLQLHMNEQSFNSVDNALLE